MCWGKHAANWERVGCMPWFRETYGAGTIAVAVAPGKTGDVDCVHWILLYPRTSSHVVKYRTVSAPKLVCWISQYS